jgi:hypothetical protein
MATRPSTGWRKNVEDEAQDIASGKLTADKAFMSLLFPESLLSDTDQALAVFESEIAAFREPSDEWILDVVKHVVLSLNAINGDHGGAGYETDERERLCHYIDQSLAEAGVDVEALATRNGMSRHDITYEWRRW